MGGKLSRWAHSGQQRPESRLVCRPHPAPQVQGQVRPSPSASLGQRPRPQSLEPQRHQPQDQSMWQVESQRGALRDRGHLPSAPLAAPRPFLWGSPPPEPQGGKGRTGSCPESSVQPFGRTRRPRGPPRERVHGRSSKAEKSVTYRRAWFGGSLPETPLQMCHVSTRAGLRGCNDSRPERSPFSLKF